MTLEYVLNTSFVLLIFIAIAFLILQLVNRKTVKQQREHFEDLHRRLKPGVEVMLTDGVYGRLTQVKKDFVRMEIAKGVEIKVSRYSIKEIIKE